MNTKDEICDALDGNRGDQAPPAIFTQTGTVGQTPVISYCETVNGNTKSSKSPCGLGGRQILIKPGLADLDALMAG